MRSLGTAIPFALALALAGCGGSPKPPPPTVVELTVTAGPLINPDESGQSSPVILRIYQLAAGGAFDKADFFALYQNESATLGADLLARDQLALAGGETRKITLQPNAGARLLGVVAAFRDIDNAEWRQEAPITANQTTHLALTVGKLGLTLAVEPAPAPPS